MNGPNEELKFTRADSDRLVRIETKLDDMLTTKDQVDENTITNAKAMAWIKAYRWIISSMIVLIAASKFLL